MTKPSVEPILAAIERARERLRAMPVSTPAETLAFASAMLDEFGKIIDVKNAYDDAVERQGRLADYLARNDPSGKTIQ